MDVTCRNCLGVHRWVAPAMTQFHQYADTRTTCFYCGSGAFKMASELVAPPGVTLPGVSVSFNEVQDE